MSRGGLGIISSAAARMHRSNSSPEALGSLAELDQDPASSESSPEQRPRLLGFSAAEGRAHGGSASAAESSPSIPIKPGHRRAQSNISMASSDGEADFARHFADRDDSGVVGSPLGPSKRIANGHSARSPLSSQGKYLCQPVQSHSIVGVWYIVRIDDEAVH